MRLIKKAGMPKTKKKGVYKTKAIQAALRHKLVACGTRVLLEPFTTHIYSSAERLIKGLGKY